MNDEHISTTNHKWINRHFGPPTFEYVWIQMFDKIKNGKKHFPSVGVTMNITNSVCQWQIIHDRKTKKKNQHLQTSSMFVEPLLTSLRIGTIRIGKRFSTFGILKPNRMPIDRGTYARLFCRKPQVYVWCAFIYIIFCRSIFSKPT